MRSLAERVAASRQGDLYEERAAILEYDAGLPRADAEVAARVEYPQVFV